MIAHDFKVLDTKTKAILKLDHKDLTSQIFRNEPEIIQSYEIVNAFEQHPQFNDICASSKDYSMRNIRDWKDSKDGSSHEDLALANVINEDGTLK